ncbi:hypothetical protein RhiirA1_459359 [Rhizophagus irregularis]|uniref:Uncharacterized protein n=1 Tax=Rhizophagus irregularis TaxID=588596 RepID=A0A2I1EIN2_9GLOM|nr:hypothetical protein RhiirA1_459359 [Rhizophagus irregularis]PKY21978.1 hypothetical protein RhiirB3_435745 [Rhizophagus irregularis]
MYDNRIGIEENINQAIYWYKKSAEQGNDDAKIKLNKLIINEMFNSADQWKLEEYKSNTKGKEHTIIDWKDDKLKKYKNNK